MHQKLVVMLGAHMSTIFPCVWAPKSELEQVHKSWNRGSSMVIHVYRHDSITIRISRILCVTA
ncbi:unnamed protein product [Periconia digitata]|uniref:Uncharacterized protein n=1 Tax=Periconia digitata TaxID=1303443 RepID=A0A9W4UFQ1_9PLEO|nr:unnamed protein product [Periconia digitata]